jgi:predicted SAM-dependent methyltransferase
VTDPTKTPTQGQGKVLSEHDIADYFWLRALDGQDRSDYAFHRKRWAFLLAQVDPLVELSRAHAAVGRLRILDIGVSLQTDLLRNNYPDIPVDTLDIVENSKVRRSDDQHLTFDLNDLYDRDSWPQIGPYDVIVMCEVIEHLYTAGRVALSFLAEILRPGGFIFLQTPNAVALHKRIQMAAGRNPYMGLDHSRQSPGHFHEFTVAELGDIARQAGLDVFEVSVHNYFSASRPLSIVYNRVGEMLPSALRAGISMTLSKP